MAASLAGTRGIQSERWGLNWLSMVSPKQKPSHLTAQIPLLSALSTISGELPNPHRENLANLLWQSVAMLFTQRELAIEADNGSPK